MESLTNSLKQQYASRLLITASYVKKSSHSLVSVVVVPLIVQGVVSVFVSAVVLQNVLFLEKIDTTRF